MYHTLMLFRFVILAQVQIFRIVIEDALKLMNDSAGYLSQNGRTCTINAIICYKLF